MVRQTDELSEILKKLWMTEMFEVEVFGVLVNPTSVRWISLLADVHRMIQPLAEEAQLGFS